MPAFVSTLCICIVFVPVIFLTGAARYLFTPLALAVVLAMMASYLLSRTLVPTMVALPAARRGDRYQDDGEHGDRRRTVRASTTRFQRWFETHARTATAACSAPRWRIASWWPPASSLLVRRLRSR